MASKHAQDWGSMRQSMRSSYMSKRSGPSVEQPSTSPSQEAPMLPVQSRPVVRLSRPVLTKV